MSLASQLGELTGQSTFEKYAHMEKEAIPFMAALPWVATALGSAGLGYGASKLFGGNKQQEAGNQLAQQMQEFGGFNPQMMQQFQQARQFMQLGIPPQQAFQYAQQMGQGGAYGPMQGGGGGGFRGGGGYNPWDYRQNPQQKPKRSLKQRLARTNRRQERLQAQMDARNAKRNPPAAGSAGAAAGSAGAPAATTPAAPTPPAATTPTPTTPTAPQQPAPSMVNPVPTGDLPSMYDQEMYELNRPDRQPTPAPAPTPAPPVARGVAPVKPKNPNHPANQKTNQAGLDPYHPDYVPDDYVDPTKSDPMSRHAYGPGGKLQSKIPPKALRDDIAAQTQKNMPQPQKQPSWLGSIGSSLGLGR